MSKFGGPDGTGGGGGGGGRERELILNFVKRPPSLNGQLNAPNVISQDEKRAQLSVMIVIIIMIGRETFALAPARTK